MRLQSQSEIFRDVFSSTRQKIRNPLHMLISYAELISEQNSEKTDSQLSRQISQLLSLCEKALYDTHLALDTTAFDPTQTPVEIFETTRKSFLDSSAEIVLISKELADLVEGGSSESLKRDVGKLLHAATNFAASTGSLEMLPNADLLHTAPPAVSIPVQNVQSTEEPLIAKIEYRGLLLVVDDDEGNRDVLSRRLLRDRYEVMLAESGKQALRMLRRYDFDLVLLDIMMPEMDGIAVLAELKRDQRLNELPVVMITAVDDVETIAGCIEAGADDYLLKPFNPVLLRARINALLERKRLQDEQKRQRMNLETVLNESRRQKEQAEQLLLNILPISVAEELKEFGSVQPMYFEDVTIVFADLVGFTASTEQLPADELVQALNEHFTACDRIVSRYGLAKLKTIGDCYMFAGGIPIRNPSHPVDSVLAAMEMIDSIRVLNQTHQVDWQLRIGMHTGSVIAGVVGIHKFAFDIWGDAVNFSSRVEACGESNRINLSSYTFVRVKDFFAGERREKVKIKEGKEVEMYFIAGLAARLLGQGTASGLSAFQARYSTYFKKALPTFPPSLFPKLGEPSEDA
jgi:adenylate cyclase